MALEVDAGVARHEKINRDTSNTGKGDFFFLTGTQQVIWKAHETRALAGRQQV